MHDFLRKSLSFGRCETYAKLANAQNETRSAETLYGLNLLYSKELYVILGALEIVVRNSFNDALKEHMGKNEWFSKGVLGPKHAEQIDAGIEKLVRIKKNGYILDDVIAQLNFGFWVHLCDRPYEKTLWNKALYKCFPYLGQKPNRGDIERRLNMAVRLRNKIAHLEPIIKYEDTLIQEYLNVTQLLYAINPETQKWFDQFCSFQNVWDNRYKEIAT